MALLLFGPMYWLNGIGGGDFKLSLALAALLGDPEPTLTVFVWTTVAGALIALADAWRKGQLGHLWQRLRSRTARQATAPLTIAYGPAFFLGTAAYAISRHALVFP